MGARGVGGWGGGGREVEIRVKGSKRGWGLGGGREREIRVNVSKRGGGGVEKER